MVFWESDGKLSRMYQNLVIGSFLENCSEATLSSKANVVSVSKKDFSVFCKFSRDEVETVFWESEAKRSRIIKSKFGYRKLFRKSVWRYFELENKCYERLKRAFFRFLEIFEWRSWKRFLGKWGNVKATFFEKVYFVESILESAFQPLFDRCR